MQFNKVFHSLPSYAPADEVFFSTFTHAPFYINVFIYNILYHRTQTIISSEFIEEKQKKLKAKNMWSYNYS